MGCARFIIIIRFIITLIIIIIIIGSHKLGVHRRFRRIDPPGEGVEFSPKEAVAWDLQSAEPVECPAGTLVVLHSAVVHYSAENTSSATRHAYSIHVIDSAPGIEYPKDNWLQRDMPLRDMLDEDEVGEN